MKRSVMAIGAVVCASGAACAQTFDNTLGDPGLSGSYAAAFLMHDDGSGEALYATGSFGVPGVPGTTNLARWNGSGWESVGGGLQNQFSNTLAEFQGDLFVGGYFDSANSVPGTAKLARWDGAAWSGVGAQLESFLSSVWDLLSYDDGSGEKLYIAGNYVNLAGNPALAHIARWDGSSYEVVGGTIGGAVPLIVLDLHPADLGSGEHLYAGGRFLNIGGVPATNIAMWDGVAWAPVGGGLARTSGFAQVLHMTSWDDGSGPALYAAGTFNLAGGAPVSNNVAKWDGTAWSSLGDGFDSTVQELIVFDDGSGEALYAMGNFSNSGATPVPRIAKWNGTDWEPVVSNVDGNVFGAIVADIGSGPAMHIGGGFSSVDGVASNRVVTLTQGASCIADWNTSGGVDIFDILDYLSAWETMDPATNLDGNGSIDIFDILAFLGEWQNGCP